VVKRAGIERTRENRFRFDIAIDTGFRKRFNTILKSNPNISYAIAERMMDHKTYLESHYLDTSNKEKFFEEYKKAIPDLIVDDSERLRVQNQKLEAEKTNLEKKSQEVDELKRKQEELERQFEKKYGEDSSNGQMKFGMNIIQLVVFDWIRIPFKLNRKLIVIPSLKIKNDE